MARGLATGLPGPGRRSLSTPAVAPPSSVGSCPTIRNPIRRLCCTC